MAAAELVGSAPDVVRRKHDLFRVVQGIPLLCLARAGGALLPDASPVREARDRLAALRERLPVEVRKYGESGTARDESEPIALAIAFLDGDYASRPDLEVP